MSETFSPLVLTGARTELDNWRIALDFYPQPDGTLWVTTIGGLALLKLETLQLAVYAANDKRKSRSTENVSSRYDSYEPAQLSRSPLASVQWPWLPQMMTYSGSQFSSNTNSQLPCAQGLWGILSRPKWVMWPCIQPLAGTDARC